MINVKFRLKEQSQKFIEPISQFVAWLNSYRDFKSNIRIIIHDYPVLSYGDLNDCQVDMRHRVIYYSLYDIEKYMEENKDYKFNYDSVTYVLFEIFEDLSLQLSKFYIIDHENINVDKYISQYDLFKSKMYQEKSTMIQQFVYMYLRYRQHLKSGLKLKKDKVKPLVLREAIQLFENFIVQQIDFPIRVKVKFTSKNLADCDGYFKYQKSVFHYPSIKVSYYEYENIQNKLGTFDAVLNILRILVHEIGHYHAFVSGDWYYDSEKREADTYCFEEKIIQKFIDKVYYNHYSNNL